MLDGVMRRLIDPPLARMGRRIARWGVTANQVTLAGLVAALVAAGLIALGLTLLALVAILLSRLADGLDGAVAGATKRTGFGGYADIVADFVFYGAVPLGFVALDPAGNGLAGAFLILCFYVNGGSFLGYAILAERHGMTTEARGAKSLYFTGGLLEGTETILFFIVLCLVPQHFAPLAFAFGALTLVTTLARLRLAWQVFGARE